MAYNLDDDDDSLYHVRCLIFKGIYKFVSTKVLYGDFSNS